MATPHFQRNSPCPNGSESSTQLHDKSSASPLHLNDLIPRPALRVDRKRLRKHLADRTVLVTGAGGSIGTELVHQLQSLQPAHLVLVDVNEHNLLALERTLDRSPVEKITVRLADVRNPAALKTIFSTHPPDVVLHAAAYKHVPFLERHPAAAFQNNTLATIRLLRQCNRHEVDQFVFVSTDKAVEPISVLGATKYLAEGYVQSSDTAVRCKIVRFGNVFGTRGSVVPRFEQRLAEGRPLPVTHPEMERYFMSSEEAGTLILQTLLLDAAPTYALKMGKPIRIQWLAKRLIERWYPDADPDSMIEYVGRRPGEKLSERLVGPEETVHQTQYLNIFGLERPSSPCLEELEAHLERLETLSHSSNKSRPELRALLLSDRISPHAPSSHEKSSLNA